MKPLIIAIAGGTGSGKSTVARNVAAELKSASVVFVEMDSYYHDFSELPAESLAEINWDHPNAVDIDLMCRDLEMLAKRKPIESPIYDFERHRRSIETRQILPADVVVIDGILLLTDSRIRDMCDVKVFVDADADIRLIRRIQRDTVERGRTLASIIEQYLSSVQPMHLEFVEPSKRYADVIVPRGGTNAVAIEMIVAKIQRRLLTS